MTDPDTDQTVTLGQRIAPCGPIFDAEAAERIHQRLIPAADEGGWTATLEWQRAA